mmetsp:Transcript_100072/g.280398  ORF Transcript_100072/g.280398 Transcript_100072/m.280398 type:complete len:210 (+) Transcript_100072:3571-4200(+)
MPRTAAHRPEALAKAHDRSSHAGILAHAEQDERELWRRPAAGARVKRGSVARRPPGCGRCRFSAGEGREPLRRLHGLRAQAPRSGRRGEAQLRRVRRDGQEQGRRAHPRGVRDRRQKVVPRRPRRADAAPPLPVAVADYGPHGPRLRGLRGLLRLVPKHRVLQRPCQQERRRGKHAQVGEQLRHRCPALGACSDCLLPLRRWRQQRTHR